MNEIVQIEIDDKLEKKSKTDSYIKKKFKEIFIINNKYKEVSNKI